MGERPDVSTIKQKFIFSAYNRVALDSESHQYDENLKFTPLPTTNLELPNLSTSRAPVLSMCYVASGGKNYI